VTARAPLAAGARLRATDAHVRDFDRNAIPAEEFIRLPPSVGPLRMVGERRRSAFSSSSAAMPRRWTR
jgi:hypothetical protein